MFSCFTLLRVPLPQRYSTFECNTWCNLHSDCTTFFIFILFICRGTQESIKMPKDTEEQKVWEPLLYTYQFSPQPLPPTPQNDHLVNSTTDTLMSNHLLHTPLLSNLLSLMKPQSPPLYEITVVNLFSSFSFRSTLSSRSTCVSFGDSFFLHPLCVSNH